jgi:hypothetical protein
VTRTPSSLAVDSKNDGLVFAHEQDKRSEEISNKHQALMDAIQQASLSDDARRVFHGRGCMFPGREQLTLDWFSCMAADKPQC